ncbi:hypothetical protein BH23ACT3_BH23ACT3_07230 [soil metagenome]
MPLIPVVVAATLKRKALRKGILGQSLLWKLVAVAAFGGPLIRRMVSKHPDVLTVEKLEPGQAMLIITMAALNRAERKQARRTRRAAS